MITEDILTISCPTAQRESHVIMINSHRNCIILSQHIDHCQGAKLCLIKGTRSQRCCCQREALSSASSSPRWGELQYTDLFDLFSKHITTSLWKLPASQKHISNRTTPKATPPQVKKRSNVWNELGTDKYQCFSNELKRCIVCHHLINCKSWAAGYQGKQRLDKKVFPKVTAGATKSQVTSQVRWPPTIYAILCNTVSVVSSNSSTEEIHQPHLKTIQRKQWPCWFNPV